MTYRPLRLFPLLCLFALGLGLLPGSEALQVTGLYSQRVAVANESEAERARAFQEALRAVVLKVTGERRWLEHPAVQRAISNAQQYVEGISYSSGRVPIPQEEQEAMAAARAAELLEAAAPDAEPRATLPALPTTRQQRYINVDFADSLIDRMLADADIPVWGSNRPSVLLWMVLQNPGGARAMLTPDSNAEIVAIARDFAEERGLPIIFPLLDFADRRNLSESQVWALDEESIRAASQRYGADSILAARLHFTASGEMVGLWKFIFQDEVQTFDGFAEDLQSYLDGPLDRVTTDLANYFAIDREFGGQQELSVVVEGVDDLRAYSALLDYIRALGLVESVTTTGLEADRLELRLRLAGSARQFDELVALDRNLLPAEVVPDQTRRGPAGLDDRSLHYRWMR